MRMLELFRSTAFRLAIAFALATAAATALVFAVVYLEISTLDVARLRLVLADEAAKGVSESDDDLRRALELRLTRDLRRLDFVALFDANGNFIAGKEGDLEFALTDASLAELSKRGINATLTLAAPAGNYRLRTVVADAGGRMSASNTAVTSGGPVR